MRKKTSVLKLSDMHMRELLHLYFEYGQITEKQLREELKKLEDPIYELLVVSNRKNKRRNKQNAR